MFKILFLMLKMGQNYKVYFEELRGDGYVAGRSDNNLLIKVKGSEELLGTYRDVKVTQTARLVQIGELVASK